IELGLQEMGGLSDQLKIYLEKIFETELEDPSDQSLMEQLGLAFGKLFTKTIIEFRSEIHEVLDNENVKTDLFKKEKKFFEVAFDQLQGEE
ncbi:MAG: hypothetical protein GWO20_20745, partial [Candidatus Korarchaeota archaeon]|nr:hypothetical protein [Candidatus Korarchaeota archaeon]